jgi:hypothetical protein
MRNYPSVAREHQALVDIEPLMMLRHRIEEGVRARRSMRRVTTPRVDVVEPFGTHA